MQKATFGAGCFWGVELNFQNIEGVKSTMVGYIGGHAETPSYEDVCTGATNHAEAVEIIFDPEVVSYEALVRAFFKMHNPTTLNRQGPDVGTQYRSAIFYHSEPQKETAIAIKNELDQSTKFKNPIVTSIEPASAFYKAEEYHQNYLARRGMRSCGI